MTDRERLVRVVMENLKWFRSEREAAEWIADLVERADLVDRIQEHKQ